MSDLIHLLTEHYVDQSTERHAEILTCLAHNLACPSIQQVHLLGTSVAIEQLPDELRLNEKLHPVPIEYRLTFKQAFEYVAEIASNQLAVISNADIYFDQTLEAVRSLDLNRSALSLSRWDISHDDKATHYNNPWSFDSWIFRGPLLPANSDFYFGIPGCDNRISYEILCAGRAMFNPSLSIKSYHLHKTEKRNYVRNRDKVPGPYLTVEATTISTATTRKIHVFR